MNSISIMSDHVFNKVIFWELISKENQNSNSNQNTVSQAQQECKEIGFIENTKKFENCVKMMK